MRRALRVLARALGAPLASVSPLGPADAVIILGAAMDGNGQLSRAAAERVHAGVGLFRRGLADVICIVGGHCPRGQHDTPAEAEGMARAVRAMGVPESAIRVDRTSRSTQTNALRAAELLQIEGRRRVWVVTQPFHLRRARHYFRRAGFEPLGWHIDDSIQYGEPALALRWIAREYAAWGLALLRALPLARRALPCADRR